MLQVLNVDDDVEREQHWGVMKDNDTMMNNRGNKYMNSIHWQ